MSHVTGFASLLSRFDLFCSHSAVNGRLSARGDSFESLAADKDLRHHTHRCLRPFQHPCIYV